MVVFLRHSDQVFRVRASSTCECDGPFTQAKGFAPTGLEVADHSLWPLAPTSLPLSAPGANGSRSGARARNQSGLHSQIIYFADWTGASAISARRLSHQPVGGGGFATRLEVATRSWLSARASAKFIAKINMCMIVSHQKKCCRFIIGWCQRIPSHKEPRS